MLAIYFPKVVLQKLANCYYMCLFKLFKFKFDGLNGQGMNDFLHKYNIFAFEHRILYRLFLFSYKLLKDDAAPENLKSQLKLNSTRNLKHDLRNKDKLIVQPPENNKYGESTFGNFFPHFINLFSNEFLCSPISIFKTTVLKKFDSHYEQFIKKFSKFNLKYKHIFIPKKQ